MVIRPDANKIEQPVLMVSVLDEREVDSDDLCSFDKGQILIARQLGNSKACGVLLVSCGEYVPTMVRGNTNYELVTGYWAQNSTRLMHEVNEGYPVRSEPTEGLLWHVI